MRTLFNIIWILLGGILTALWFALMGVVFYITIVGIPLGRQSFKMAKLTLAPFGKDIVYGGGAPSIVANVFWALLVGVPTALWYLLVGLVFCITVIGAPFGLQLFKMAKLSLFPFGAEVLEG